ncbi:MAG TPA: fibronectin type III domain-containing protein, partial [Candidatus Andersenbacteria bacterium]|nr:fibronectin type III domain-containing protein [Candidatus Andersenbacteria bacterium]
EANSPDISVTAGSDTITFTGSSGLHNIDFTGFTGALTINAYTVYGNYTFSSGMSFTGTAGSSITFAATSGTKTITTNAQSISNNFIFNGVGGTWQFGDNLTMGSARQITLTNGTLDGNGKDVSIGFFNASNSNVRTLTFGTGQWSITGNAGTVWNCGTATNFTVNRGTHPVNFTYSGSTGTRTFSMGSTGATESNSIDFSITAGSDTVNFSGSSTARDLDFTGFSGTWNNNNFFVYGNLTWASGMTIGSGASAITMAATSGTKTLTTNGKTLDFPLIFNGAGGTFQLGDNLTMGATRTLTLTNGTFNSNNKTITIGGFATSNSNTRTFTLGTGAMTLTGTGTVFSCANSSGLTLNQTGTIVVSDTSATAKIWNGGNGATWGPVTISGDNVTINGSNTWSTLNNNTAGLTTGLVFQSGFTQVITTAFTSNGSAGNLAKLSASTPGSAATLSKSSGTVSVDYMSITDSAATGGATWLAGSHSTDGGGNSGWQFILAPSNFNGTAASNTSITWTWTDNSDNETGFKLYDSSNTLIATIAANTTSYTETGLTRDTNYTRYLVAYNSTSTSNATSNVTVTTNSNNPNSFSLISPADGALSGSGLPTFSFYKSTETAGTISSYTLYVGNTSYTGIPASGSAASSPSTSTDYKDTYTAQYFNEGDGNSTNDTISVTLKGTPIPDGKYSWYVKAIDTDGNTTVTGDRTIRIDATRPGIGTLVFSGSDISPTLSTTVTDNYSLHGATVTLEKANSLFGGVVSYTTVENKTYSLSGTSEAISFTPKSNLVAGNSYRYTVTVTDSAGNQTTSITTKGTTSSQQQSGQNVESLNPETASTQEIITALRGTLPPSLINIPQLEAQAVVRRQLQAAEFQKLLDRIKGYLVAHQGSLIRGWLAWYGPFEEQFDGFQYRVASLFQGYNQFAYHATGGFLAWIQNTLRAIRIDGTNAYELAVQSIKFTQQELALAGQGLLSSQHTRVAQGLANRQLINKYIHNVLDPMRSTGTQIALKMRSVYEIVFDKAPTRISNLAMTNLSPTSVTISWDTNHLTNLGKVNYGTSTSYTQEAFEQNGLRDHHEVTLNNLNPQTTYYFEVMNHDGSYVYDAYYTVTTPASGQQAPAPRLVPQDAVIQGTAPVPVYESPDPAAKVVKTLLPGTILRALKEQEGWVSVLLLSGQEVWVHSDAVKLQDHIGASASAQH